MRGWLAAAFPLAPCAWGRRLALRTMRDGSLGGYLRFGTIGGPTVAFVSEDDLWTVPAEGGQARRVTADLVGIASPALSPDGKLVAFTSYAQGQAEVYVVPAQGGMATRLTWLGAPRRNTKVLGWTPDGKVAFATDAGQPFSSLTMPYTIRADGTGAPEPLPYGPVGHLSFGPHGGVAIGRNTADPARWKRYRGGTAGSIWLDRDGNGDFRLLLRPDAIGGNFTAPMWVGERIYFLSDHEGIGNLYSCSLEGTDLKRHTDHSEYYARLASSDGRRIIYQVAAKLWTYDPATDSSRPLEVELGSPRTQRQPRFVPAERYLNGYCLDKTGEHLVVGTRGKLFSFAAFDGPVVQIGVAQGVRYRLARFLAEGTGIVAVSDASGTEALEVHAAQGPGETGRAVRRLEVPDLGRPLDLAVSPDGAWVAVTNHKHQLLLVPTGEEGESRVVDESPFGPITGPAWSPDGCFVAYSFPASTQTSQIKLVGTKEAGAHAITEPEFRDFCPSWCPTGKYLYFLSRRTFDPVYDSLFFDLGFPLGSKPYLVTLQADLPSPFLERPAPEGPQRSGSPSETSPPPGGPDGAGEAWRAKNAGPDVPPSVRTDLEGITQRAVVVPVPEARYERIVALDNKLLLLSRPPEGSLKRDWAVAASPANGTLGCYDLVEDHLETWLTGVADLEVSTDRQRLAYTFASEDGHEGRRLRVVSTASKPDADLAKEPPGRRSGLVDLGRLRVLVEPGAEWAQMVKEAWRLQRDHFWAEDLSGVDWQKVLDRYLPLVELVATRSELSDLIWEMQGELGTSHSYELGGEYREPPAWGQAHLGADLTRDGLGDWVVTRLVPGTSWDPEEASPLLTPGARIRPGTVVLAVNGQPVDPNLGPAPLLANQAGLPVELTVADPPERPAGASVGRATGNAKATPRRVVVRALADEGPLRYRDWVLTNREKVRQATGGRAGYIHIPDMGPRGWAEFHRSYLSEVERDALLVDVRFNAGGHVSGLLLEKLARRRIGWDVPRWGAPVPYPQEAPVGPLVLVTNEWAGSDGDIFTHGWKMLGLGPIVGTRTWGGVIGIEVNETLVDGSLTTQPEYAFWFDDVGWEVENRGALPDEEVLFRPQDYAAGHDPQLERAIELVSEALGRYRRPQPELGRRPAKPLPVLPARN